MKHKHPRRSIRLRNYDYSSSGVYFITLLTDKRINYFGDLNNEGIMLSVMGEIAHKYWESIPKHSLNTQIDEFVVMPNHIHGLIRIENPKDDEIDKNAFQKVVSNSISSIIQSYKAAVTRTLRKNGFKDPLWQRNFYEHIVRSEEELMKCREYIVNNPLKWHIDRNNPRSNKFTKGGSIY